MAWPRKLTNDSSSASPGSAISHSVDAGSTRMSLNWDVQAVRLTIFALESVSLSDKDWQAFTGQDEAETRQAIPGGRRFSGRMTNGVFSISAAGSRADIVLEAPDPQGPEIRLPVIGPLDEIFNPFVENTSKWLLETQSSVVRIAFGSVLLFKTANRVEAYDHLRDLLASVNVDPERMFDLLYRVNWRRASTVEEGLKINRLASWGALRFIRKMVEFTREEVVASPEEIYAVTLEMDHNTDDAHRTPFDRNRLLPIYSELVDLARENAAKGEVP